MRKVRESSFIKQGGEGLLVPPTPGLGARVKDPRVPFRPRPRERSSGPCPGCSPRTPRTCRCPGVWPGGWSASWWYCLSRRTPCRGRRRGGTRLISQLCTPPSSPPRSYLHRFSWPRPAQAPSSRPSPCSRFPPSPVVLLDVLPVLGPAHVGRWLAQDLCSQLHRGAFARLSVIWSLLNFRRD